jgi:hypothetical protein
MALPMMTATLSESTFQSGHPASTSAARAVEIAHR